MKHKLFIFFIVLVLLVILAGLNAATYVQKEKTPDAETMPNRSTFNSGPTGTQAFYTLLNETGRTVVRWQEPTHALISTKKKPAVFVVVGSVRREFTHDEATSLLQWVGEGGRLVIIDRAPPEDLVATTSMWRISVEDGFSFEMLSVDPSEPRQMTASTAAVKPVQPSIFTAGVNAVQPSRFAGAITFERVSEDSRMRDDTLPPKSVSLAVDPGENAPVAHFASGDKNLLVDVPYGNGRIVCLADPFIVSNSGISLADNTQAAINLVTLGEGVIAFDEYHQGYGADNNRFLQFFAGTPVVAIFLQAIVLVGLVFFSKSRRFARPVPEPEPDRLSKLEYVSAMAELQQRAQAFDLAIENIYADFRRRVTRALGLDNLTAGPADIAQAVAERTGLDRNATERTLLQCEDLVRGEPTSKREVLALVTELRSIETHLGLRRAARKI